MWARRAAFWLMATTLVMAGVAAACDAGKRADEPFAGPYVKVLGANVGPNRPMPENGYVEIAFDRYLLPSTAIRQSVAILDGNNQPLPQELAPLVIYDPIARTLALSNPAPGSPWLRAGLTYKVLLGIPKGDEDLGGVRAIDRATLDPSANPIIEFVVSPVGIVPPSPIVSYCRDVQPIFAAKCNSPDCHGPGAAGGLRLDSSTAVRTTLLHRVAQSANTASSTRPEETSRVFGINMPLVKPGDPGNSWLLYKVELAKPPVVDTGVNPVYACEGPERPGVPPSYLPYRPLSPVRVPADEREREILSDHVTGREMPYPRGTPRSSEEQALTFDEREKLRIWIAGGAPVLDCGGCGVPVEGAP